MPAVPTQRAATEPAEPAIGTSTKEEEEEEQEQFALQSSVSYGHVNDDLAWLALRGLAVARGETFSLSATKTNALRNIAGRNSILNLAVNAMYAA